MCVLQAVSKGLLGQAFAPSTAGLGLNVWTACEPLKAGLSTATPTPDCVQAVRSWYAQSRQYVFDDAQPFTINKPLLSHLSEQAFVGDFTQVRHNSTH